MACGEVVEGSDVVTEDGCVLPPAGTKARVLLANLDDVEEFVEDADGVITDITMKSGKTFFAFTGFRNDAKKSEEVLKPEIGPAQFKHNAGWVIYERTQDQKNNIEGIVRGRTVAIFELKGKDDTSFEVVGKEVGLEIVAGPIRNAHENGGFFVLSLSTPDDQGEYEPKLPQTLLDTDYATTLALVDGLLPVTS